ncbi:MULTISPECIES: hypothetical protein [Roseobacteraceae]|nr:MULTISPECIES: hypothetical protein [Roseobacteraceae]MBT3143969.1 hypothetical protein [Falsiruegeria litorea]MBT8168998.1 hypothetical protein [Falsiruegeria litorea]
MLALIIGGSNACLFQAIDAATPYFGAGMLVLFCLILYRTGWSAKEAFAVLFGLRGRQNAPKIELAVLGMTILATIVVASQALEACTL